MLERRKCEYCKKTYQPKVWYQKYCSSRCRLMDYYRRVLKKEKKLMEE